MKLRSVQGWLPLVMALLLIGIAFDILTRSRISATTAVECQGEYADTLEIQSPKTRDIEQGPRSQYTYLVRSSAKYECPFFGPDGKLRRRRVQATEVGTAFAYEQSGSDTYLFTNEHVASWPDVTDFQHRIDGVPEGCKRMEDKLRIVRDERDDFEPGQIPLQRVVVDPLLDAAILKANQKLTVIPYRIGKSAGVRQGNAVLVRGFPLGVMQAVSSGKIVNPYDRDQEQGWDHVDFVIDALLAEGNSGSPVLALSCRTRELELVGVYHAGYKGHGALNVVVGVDQLIDFMHKKKRVPRALTAEGTPGLGVAERGRVRDALSAGTLPLFDFGGLVVRAENGDDALYYHVFSRQFPLDDRRVVVLEDLAKPGVFGDMNRLWVQGPLAWREWPPAALGADERELVARVGDSIRLQILHSVDYRHALANPTSVEERRRGRELSRLLARDTPLARDLSNNLLDMAERLTTGRDNGTTFVGSGGAGGTSAGTASAPPTPAPLPASGLPAASR
ncbi:MAG TPA: trypsin-like peptidase domain-containing protein [Polyangia bacterium]|nr:trypsin-like peptidase domain-containing protein [Polyangia bacterium]